MKFKPKNNDRVREHMQWMFCYGIAEAAIAWARAGMDPSHEWAELYDHVMIDRTAK
jgi:hypothetical protein